MRMVDLILKKRAGKAHTQEELLYIVDGYANGRIPDYQMAAWMMAVCFQGMSERETAWLTYDMTYSGDVIDLSDIRGVKVDKHSTGGVGDTTTLAVAPMVAACGGVVAKMSGRGLGHTGGTLDKLESIPGVRVELPIEEFKSIVSDIGLCVAGQTGTLDPADKAMYALRDVTGTVESVPLIASSIMSKKLASGANALMLDVKCGTGAFMTTVSKARELAHIMVRIGSRLKRRTMAVITDMNQPLGMAIGNGLEVREAIELLRGDLPAGDPLYEVCMVLGENMLVMCGLAQAQTEARKMLEAAIASGAALAKLEAMLRRQGAVDAAGVIADPSQLCKTKSVLPFTLGRAGYIGAMKARDIGVAAQLLGAGRATKQDTIDPAVGMVLKKRHGDYIEADEPFAQLYVNDESNLEDAQELLRGAVQLCEDKPKEARILYGVVRE